MWLTVLMVLCLMLGASTVGATRSDTLDAGGDVYPLIVAHSKSYMTLSREDVWRRGEAGTYYRAKSFRLPFYEVLTLRADHLGHRGLGLHVQAQSGVDLADIHFDNRVVADLTYGYAVFRHRGLDVRLGRQRVFTAGGVKLDGLYVAYTTPLFLGMEVFGGVPVHALQSYRWYQDGADASEVRLAHYRRGFSEWERDGELVFGGRLYHKVSTTSVMGLSYLQRLMYGETDSRLLGVDFSLSPVSWLHALGRGNFSLRSQQLRDADVTVTVLPHDRIWFDFGYQHINPSLYLGTLSIFSVFSNQVQNRASTGLYLAMSPRVSLESRGGIIAYGVESVDASYLDVGAQLGSLVQGDLRCKLGALSNPLLVNLMAERIDGPVSSAWQFGMRLRLPLYVPGLSAHINSFFDVYHATSDGTFGASGDLGVHWQKGPFRTGMTTFISVPPGARAKMKALATFSYLFHGGGSR